MRQSSNYLSTFRINSSLALYTTSWLNDSLEQGTECRTLWRRRPFTLTRSATLQAQGMRGIDTRTITVDLRLGTYASNIDQMPAMVKRSQSGQQYQVYFWPTIAFQLPDKSRMFAHCQGGVQILSGVREMRWGPVDRCRFRTQVLKPPIYLGGNRNRSEVLFSKEKGVEEVTMIPKDRADRYLVYVEDVDRKK